MGRNIDMVRMFGDFTVTCPHCGHVHKSSKTYLKDIDVDGSNFNPENGVWCVKFYCYKCEKDFPLRLEIEATQVEEITR